MVSKEATLDAVEAVIDTVDETVETLERIPNLALNGTTRKQQIVILTATALAAASASGVLAHLVTKKVLINRFEDELQEQLEAARRHYAVIDAKPALADIAPVEKEVSEAAEYIERTDEYRRGWEPEAVPDEVVNIFTESTVIGQWDQEVEESKRDEDYPYVISKAEYDEGDLDFEQEALTYYAGDDVLSDSDDSAIAVHVVDGMVGESNLLRFGHGSGDENVVYVRSPRLQMDYEITRSPGHYAREVAAASFLQHDDEGFRPRKRRRFDE